MSQPNPLNNSLTTKTAALATKKQSHQSFRHKKQPLKGMSHASQNQVHLNLFSRGLSVMSMKETLLGMC
jgi:hypothetical protein